MRNFLFAFCGFVLLFNACASSSETPEQAAEAFLKDLARLDYEAAATRAAPETKELLDMMKEIMASVSEEQLAQARTETGKNQIAILRSEPVDDTKVTVVYKVSSADHEERVDMVLVDGKWLAKVEKSDIAPDTASGSETPAETGAAEDHLIEEGSPRYLLLGNLEIVEEVGAEGFALLSRGTWEPSGIFDESVTPLTVEYFSGVMTQDPELMVTVPVFGMGENVHFGFLQKPLPAFMESEALEKFKVEFDGKSGYLFYLWEKGREGSFLADVPVALSGDRVRYLLDYQAPDGSYHSYELSGPVVSESDSDARISMVMIDSIQRLGEE